MLAMGACVLRGEVVLTKLPRSGGLVNTAEPVLRFCLLIFYETRFFLRCVPLLRYTIPGEVCQSAVYWGVRFQVRIW